MTSTQALEKRMDLKFAASEKRMDDRFDELAIMIKNSFDHVDKKFEQMVTKEEFEKKMGEIDKRFDGMDRRFDIIENISVGNQGRRIENLEDRVRVVETKTGIKKR